VQSFLSKWLERLPMPLEEKDRRAGYDYRLSIWQMEMSLTQVLDRPLAGRQFFRRSHSRQSRSGPARSGAANFPAQNHSHHSRELSHAGFARRGRSQFAHQLQAVRSQTILYKEGRALRTEGTFHDPCDFGVNKGLENMAYLKQLGRQINRRLLEVERVSHNCGLSAASIQRVVLPTVGKDGLRAPGLKFGDPRVMALMLALAMFGVVIAGFRNRELRRRVAALGELTPAQYSARQISYDLTRLRRKGLIFRAQGSHRYYPTPYGCKLARLYARLEVRVFRPALSAMQERVVEMPTPLQNALQGVDRHFDQLIQTTFPTGKAA
jgi:hypothetical protein